MSREVEVKNISMTATTPEDTQISLGHLTLSANEKGYADNSGFLAPASTGAGATADDNGVKAPSAGSNPADMLDWTNSLDVSNYYALGRIIPASSVSGQNIYFTPDARGVGQEIKSDAGFYQAAAGTTGYKWDGSSKTYTNSGSGDDAKTTLHAFTSADDRTDASAENKTSWLNKSTGGYTAASGWNTTNDDGYYVDIPVWFRTSAKDGVKLAVDAYVIPKTIALQDVNAENVLYKAMRVSIIPDVTATENEGGLNRLLPVKDAWDSTSTAVVSDPWATSLSSIVDFYGRELSDGSTDSSLKGTKDAADSVSTYGAAVPYTANACVVDLTGTDNKGSGTGYGDARKYYVRVWLEGEDPECWNANAGQDFTVNLKFIKIDN